MDQVVSNQSMAARIEALLVQRPVILQLLRFVAIGILNTALDFIILNFFSKFYHIDQGVRLGLLNIISFVAATIQSYIWNRYWAFEGSLDTSVYRNFVRLVLVGGLGFVAFALVLIGAAKQAVPGYYLVILIAFIIGEAALWKSFNLKSGTANTGSHPTQFVSFVVVSAIGLLINSGLVSVVSGVLPAVLSVNSDLIKNVAKVVATGASLVWNFIGYKLIVFKK